MEIKFEVSKKKLDKLEKFIKKKLTQITENVGVQTYNMILTGEYPYYSGSYISSWNISVGSPDLKYNVPSGLRGAWSIPEVIYSLSGVSFGQNIYITNAAPHASLVEYEGTPTHPENGWYIAAHAKNQILLTYKLN